MDRRIIRTDVYQNGYAKEKDETKKGADGFLCVIRVLFRFAACVGDALKLGMRRLRVTFHMFSRSSTSYFIVTTRASCCDEGRLRRTPLSLQRVVMV
jgi:hypothetical protein